MSSRTLRHFGVPLVGLLAASLVAAGSPLVGACSPPDPNRATVVGFVDSNGDLDPSLAQFKDRGVSRFLERRCGTLDCHGRPERPLRIYGSLGLRLPNDAGLRPTTGDTSNDEVTANYEAVVGLQPEVMTRVVAAHAQGDCAIAGEPAFVPPPDGQSCARRLLLIAKPLGCNKLSSIGCNGSGPGVEHKGGAVIGLGDEAYNCLVTWLEGAADADQCTAAANAY